MCIFLYLFVRSLTSLCFMFVHCGWAFFLLIVHRRVLTPLFTNCSSSCLDTTESISIMCNTIYFSILLYYYIFINRNDWGEGLAMVENGNWDTNEHQLQVISQMQCLKRTNVSKMCERIFGYIASRWCSILFSLQQGIHTKSVRTVRRTGFQLVSKI
jgi:hypothetical protein